MKDILNGSRSSSIKKIEASFLALIMVMTTMSTMMVFFATPASADDTATIWTTDIDGNIKGDFAPGDIVYIHGSGFTPDATIINMSMTRPDGHTDYAPNGRFPPELPVTDSEGSFSFYEYNLDGITGDYIIDATDGTNSATVTFSDSVHDLSLIYPNGGEIVSGTININVYVFGGSDSGTVYAYYGIGTGGPWTSIGSVAVDGDGYYNIPWNTNGVSDGTNYYMQLDDEEPGHDEDFSDGPFVVCNGGASVLLNDGFEWAANWASTHWYQSSDQKYSGTYSAKSSDGNEGDFICDDINAVGATSITVDFWYRLDDTEGSDLKLYYYDGSGYDSIADIGGGTQDTWLHYTASIIDSQYFKSNFRIRFSSSPDDSNENVWVDDVSITVVGGTGASFVDGFEVTWDGNWDNVPHSWEDDTNAHTDSYAARSSDGHEGYFTCNDLDASGASSIGVSFWYRLDDTEDTDLTLYYYDGSSYDSIADIGGGTEDTWLHYTAIITDSQYFKSNFKIRFGSSLGSGENVWVDDVLISICSGCTPSTWYKDADDDGYSDGTTLVQCERPDGYKLASELIGTSGDCDDDDDTVYPGAPEICDGKDNNCNGQTDEGFPDYDQDGIADCVDDDIDGDGYTVAQGDCDDYDPTVHPWAEEICGDGKDNDCDGKTDEGCCGHSCLIPDALGNNIDLDIKDGDLQSLLDAYANLSSYLPIYVEGPGNDQSHYQIWNYAGADVVVLRVEFVGVEAGNSNVFGYYVDGDTNTFTPLFCVKGTSGGGHYHSGYPGLQILEPGEYIANIVIPKGTGNELGFAMCSDDDTGSGVGSNNTFYSKIDDNEGDEDHTLVFDLCDGKGKYVVCFEDVPLDISDKDYEDLVTIVEVLDCYEYIDFGDAPDPTYPTLSVNNGASHRIAGPWFGDATDAPDPEINGQPTIGADGDDNNGNDDENGVTISALEIGETNTITYEVNGGGGNVWGWIDFNADGDWDDSGEQVISGLAKTDGTHTLDVAVPSGLSECFTYARFRITTNNGIVYTTGEEKDGEVEDYKVELVDTKQPTQAIEFGNPQEPTTVYGGLKRISGHTPIWINSIDIGTGTEYMVITINYDNGQINGDPNPCNPNTYASTPQIITVWDWNSTNSQTGTAPFVDQDPTFGRISVLFTIEDTWYPGSCYHEIDADCWDRAGNWNLVAKDVIVDSNGPTVTHMIGNPNCTASDKIYVTLSTEITLTAEDYVPFCENCTTGCVEKIYWTIQLAGDEPTEYEQLGSTATFKFYEECHHILYYWAVDCLGNIGPIYGPFDFYVDETAPTSIISFDPECANQEKTYIRNTSLITITASDDDGCKVGTTKIHYRVWANGQWTTLMTGQDNQDVVFTLESLGAPWENDCTHYIEYYAEDCLHNIETPVNNKTVYVDNTGPEKVKMQWGSPSYIRADGKIFITTATYITLLEPEDQIQPDCASGVTGIYYQIWYNGVWGEPKKYTGEFRFAENCTHMLKAWAVDCLGNIGDVNITTFYVDEEKPLQICQYVPPPYEDTDGWNWISNNTVKIIYGQDEGCGVGGAGVQRIEWSVKSPDTGYNSGLQQVIDNEDWSYEDDSVKVTGDNDPREGFISINITILESCYHIIEHWAYDYLGNVGYVKQNTYVDTLPPVIIKIIGKPQWPHLTEEGNYYVTSDTRIYVEVTDNETNFPCNVSSVHLRVGVEYKGEWFYFGDNGWINVSEGTASVNFTFREIEEIYGMTGFGNECMHNVSIYAEDDVGNSLWYDNETFYVDNTPPDSVKIVGDPHYSNNLPAGATPGEDYYVRGDTPITIQVRDNGTEPCIVGSTHLYYRIWYDGIWHDYEEHSPNGIDITFTFAQKDLGNDCIHYLEYYVEDNLGNRWPEAGWHNETFYVDNTPPAVTKEVGQPQYPTANRGDYYITKDTPIWINVTEQGLEPCIVGSTTLHYSVLYKGVWYNDIIHHEKTDGPINFEFTFAELANHFGVPNLADDCEHKLRIWVEDNLGNHWPTDKEYHEEIFYVDNTPPIVTKEVGEPKWDVTGEPGNYYVTKYTPIYINASDDQTKGCAVNSTHIKFTLTYNGRTESWWVNDTVDGIQNLVYTFEGLSDYLSWPELGNDCEHILTYEAWDDLGNYFGSHTETFYVDNQPPVSTKEVGEPKYTVGLPQGDYYVTSNTPIWINATDNTTFNPCVVGSVHLHYRVYYYKTGTYTQWENITVSSGTLSKMITLEGECLHRLDYWVEDNLGNRWPQICKGVAPSEMDGWHSEYFYVDNSEPEVIKTVKCPKYKDDLPDGDWFITNKTKIKIDVADQGTEPCIVGSTHLYYAVEYNGVWYNDTIHHEKVDGPIHFEFTFESLAAHFGIPSLADDCEHKLRIWVEDNLGNHWPTDKEYHEEIFYVDNTPPVTTKTIVEPYCALKQDTILFQDDFEYTCHENPLHHGWFGDYFGKPDTYGIWDDIGIREIGSNQVAEIDDDAAMIRKINTEGFENIILSYCAKTSSVSPSDKLIVLYKFGAYSNNVDDWTLLEEINSDTWQCSSWELTGAEDSHVFIAFFMNDGNEDYGLVDNVIVTGDPIYEQPYYWVTTDTEITLTAEDFPDAPCKSGIKDLHFIVFWDHDNDGCADVPVSVDIIEETTTSVTFKFKQECLHKIVWYAVDNLGNKELINVQYHRVDDTPPEIIKTVGEPSITDDGKTWWVTTDTEINLKAIDHKYPCAVGGVFITYRIWYLGNWTEWMPYEGNFTFHEDCVHYLEVEATDCLGNTACDNETFVVHGTVEGVPTLVKPADGMHLSYIPILVWNPVADVDTYHVELDDDINFASPLIDETVAETSCDPYDFVSPDDFVDNTPYYWHVASVYTSGTIGQFSDTWWFTIDMTAPIIEEVYSNDADDTVIAGIDVVITIKEANDETGLIGSVTIDGFQYGLVDNNDGTYSYTWSVPVSQPDGDYIIDARLEDAVGHYDTNSDLVITVISPAGPTTSGTDVEPDSSIVGTTLTVTATAHSTISTIAGAEYFINTKGTSGEGTPLSPVDGVWDETTEDVTATIVTTGWEDGEYTIYVHGKDVDNRWGAYDEEEFTLVDPASYRPVVCSIIFPEDMDEFEVSCGQKYIEVIINAYRPAYNGLPKDYDVDVKLEVTEVIEGAVATYYPTWNGEYFTVDVDIYKYQSNAQPAELILQAFAKDEYYNSASSFPLNIFVDTTVGFSVMLNAGWNGPINLAVLGCDDSTESVLASIDPYYDFIFEVGTWDSYWHNMEEEYMNGGPLQHIDPAGWYWIHMTEAARFFIDSTCPDVAIEYPEDEETYYDSCFDDFRGYACDIETGVVEVVLTIYDDYTGLYWNGITWTEEESQLPCVYEDMTKTWYYPETDDIDFTYISGHELMLTVTATDMSGCSCDDTVWFMFVDDNAPYVEISYPENDVTYDDCIEPSEIYGIAYDWECETIVTCVFIQIYDETTELYWDGDSWEESATDLPCTYDETLSEWTYDGNLPEWVDEHEYSVYATAYDAAGNTGSDQVWFYYECEELGSISGTVYYYGEGTGNVTVWLFDEIFGSGPIANYVIPTDVQGYPVIGTYIFDNLADGTYYVAGFMDYNENNGYDIWEPLGFAVNKSTFFDEIEVIGASDETDKDITLYDPDPSIELTKYVWADSYWNDEGACADVGENVRFNISIHNNGISAPLFIEKIVDELPEGLDYVEGSTEIWVVTPAGTQYGTPDPDQDGTTLTWDLSDSGMMIFPCWWIYLEFEAEVLECNEEPYDNWAEVTAWYEDLEIYDDDSAYVWVPCEQCMPSYSMSKYTWCYEYEDWYNSYGYARDYDNYARFKIEFFVTGDCPIEGDIYIRDELPENIICDGNHHIEFPAGLTLTASYYDPVTHSMYFNFTGTLNAGEQIVIEFNASYTGGFSEMYSETNIAYGSTSIEGTTEVSDDSMIYYNWWPT